MNFTLINIKINHQVNHKSWITKLFWFGQLKRNGHWICSCIKSIKNFTLRPLMNLNIRLDLLWNKMKFLLQKDIQLNGSLMCRYITTKSVQDQSILSLFFNWFFHLILMHLLGLIGVQSLSSIQHILVTFWKKLDSLLLKNVST